MRTFFSRSLRREKKTLSQLSHTPSLSFPPQLPVPRTSTAKRADGTMLASMNLRSTGKSRNESKALGAGAWSRCSLQREEAAFSLYFLRSSAPLCVLDWVQLASFSCLRERAFISICTLAVLNRQDNA